MSKCPNPKMRTADRTITETFCVSTGRLFGLSYPNCGNLLVPRVKRGSSNCVLTEGTIGTKDLKLNCLGEVLMLTQRHVWSNLSLVRGFKSRRTQPLVPSLPYPGVP
jgi:hypothetical protein